LASVILAPQLFTAIGQLTPKEQARVISFIQTFQANPSSPGISLERITRARSKNVWSGRVTRDLRAILHKDGDTWAMVYVDHHDQAYTWAQRREIGRHAVTGSLQIIEAVETVREVERIIEIPVEPQALPTFRNHSDDYLLSLGVPESWLPALREVRNDEQLLMLCEKLPAEVAERLFDLEAGELVTPPPPIPATQPVTAAHDTRHRFYVVGEDVEGLVAALRAPMDRWIAFLHPAQKALVQRSFRGPSKVSGSAGTGKTVVAMHRVRHLARQGESVLLTSFVSTLCENIDANLGKLCTEDERSRIQVSTVHKEALAMVRRVEPQAHPAKDDEVEQLLQTLGSRYAPGYSAAFIKAEWDGVVRAQGIERWAEYRRARRTGRGKGLAVTARKELWRVFGETLERLRDRHAYDWPGLCRRAQELIEAGELRHPYTAVVVDEVQDLGPSALRFLKALCQERPGSLMLCGDAGQRIYPGGFSLSALGIEVRGRSAVLRINYRTTEQIRRLADRMVGDHVDDMQGGTESRKGTRSLLHGPQPRLRGHASQQAEQGATLDQVQRWLAQGLAPEAIGIFARTHNRIGTLTRALEDAGVATRRLSDKGTVQPGTVNVGTMHRAKGLEFKVVLVADCGDSELPQPAAIRHLQDPQDIETATERERRLLYVAMTRARDELVVSWNGRPSRFLAPLLAAQQGENE